MNKDLSRGNKYPFFPDYDFDIETTRDMKVIKLSTTIRKQNMNSVWMFWDVVTPRFVSLDCSDELIQEEVSKATREFISECYKVIILGVIPRYLIFSDGRKVFKRDPNQESETERLSRL